MDATMDATMDTMDTTGTNVHILSSRYTNELKLRNQKTSLAAVNCLA